MIQPRIGQRVTVAAGSGLESGVTGVVVSRASVPTDGRGVPQLDLGHYRPFTRSEVAIRDDSGRLFTMFCNRLRLSGNSA